MTTKKLIDTYIKFFETRDHKRIPNSPLVPTDDPTTLFTSSGMQPLVPYLLGQPHALGKRLVNVQNCFRAQDIDQVGDMNHTTFFRMLGNWSLGDYFKKEQLVWFFEFLTKELGILDKQLYVSVFEGFGNIPRDQESANIWQEIFEKANLNPGERIFFYGPSKNWWSRSGGPEDMPEGEPGGPDSEVFYDFETPHDRHFGKKCHPNCQCGRFLEIGNSVFMQYKKSKIGFEALPQKNVDFGGGLERILAVLEGQPDLFRSVLLKPIIKTIEKQMGQEYKTHAPKLRIIADHTIAACFIAASGISPSNTGQGYILRRLIRRTIDCFYKVPKFNLITLVETIIDQYKETDPQLPALFEKIKYTLLEEEKVYRETLLRARNLIVKKYKEEVGDELKGQVKISADDAFLLYATHGLSPTQIKSLGFIFSEHDFAQKMQKHQKISQKGAAKKFAR